MATSRGIIVTARGDAGLCIRPDALGQAGALCVRDQVGMGVAFPRERLYVCTVGSRVAAYSGCACFLSLSFLGSWLFFSRSGLPGSLLFLVLRKQAVFVLRPFVW